MPPRFASAFVTRFPLTRETAIGRVRLRTLVLTRWIAVFGQTVTILFVYFVLGYDLPVVLALAAVGASAMLNVVVTLRYPASKRLGDTVALLYLAYDTLQLAVLLFLTGGLHNPFSVLMLGTVTISATILSVRSTIWLGTLFLICVSILMFFHLPLPWQGGEHELSHIYVFGIWTSLAVGMVFFSVYVLRVAEEGRRMSDALTATQMALAREHRISALGGLAAAAAHELGTPLSTIALVAKEMSHEFPADSPYSEDSKLLLSQSDRCRDILARLTLSPEDKSGAPFHRMPLTTLIESAARPHHREGVNVEVGVDPAHTPRRSGTTGGEAPDAAAQPMVLHSLEIVHGIENLIENAVDFADSRVSIAVGWSESEAYVEIADDGPGFSKDILGALGEPYVSTRRDSGGMGLGVFIAKTLLERTGAEVAFGNRCDGGARIVITWPRPLLETEASERASEAHDPSDRTEDDHQ